MRPYGSVRGAVSDGRPYRDTDTPRYRPKFHAKRSAWRFTLLHPAIYMEVRGN